MNKLNKFLSVKLPQGISYLQARINLPVLLAGPDYRGRQKNRGDGATQQAAGLCAAFFADQTELMQT